VLSAPLIVDEMMTDDAGIILPIMFAAGLSCVVPRLIDSESIHHNKLSRRGESIARGHDMRRLEPIPVRNVMPKKFPRASQHGELLGCGIRTLQANYWSKDLCSHHDLLL